MKTNKEGDQQAALPSIYVEKEESKRKALSYYRALRELKDIDKKIMVVKNRIGMLTQKQQQAEHPVGDYFEERQARLKTLNKQSKQQSLAQLKKIKERVRTEVSLKKLKNQSVKEENSRRVNKARQWVIQEKYKKHDSIYEQSIEDKKRIERLKFKSLMEKKQKHNQMIEHSRQSRAAIQEMQQSRVESIRAQCDMETSRIIEKVLKKARELNQIEQKCSKHEQKLKQVLNRKERKLKRILPAWKQRTVETSSSLIVDKQMSSTPKSGVSFVIIT